MIYKKDQDTSVDSNDPFHSSRSSSDFTSSFGMHSVVRLIGAGVMVAGLVIGFQVVGKAWELFDDASSIARLAEEIELHSNVNKTVQAFGAMMLIEYEKADKENKKIVEQNQFIAEQTGQNPPPESLTAPPLQERIEFARSLKQLNIVYFSAWGIGFILLWFIGRVAFWALVEGAKVAVQSNAEKNTKPRHNIFSKGA